MPQLQIKLDDITNWILDKFNKPDCSICGENAWEFSDKLWQQVEYSSEGGRVLRIGGDTTMGRNALVMVFLICMNCKQVHLFNAVAIAMQQQLDAEIIKAPPIPPEEPVH